MGYGTICVWHTDSGQVAAGPFESLEPIGNPIFSPDGINIAFGSWGRAVHIVGASTGIEVRKISGHPSIARSVSYSPDGKKIAPRCNDQTICVWNTENGNLVAIILKAHTDSIHSLAFSPDGIVSGSYDKTACVWNAVSGKLITTYEGHDDVVASVCFSPDGSNIASASDDATIRIWDSKTGKLRVLPLKWHSWAVRSVAFSFSPDGQCLVTRSDDITVCVGYWRDSERHES